MTKTEKITEEAFLALHAQYKSTGDKSIRNRLVLEFEHVPKTVAMQLRGLSASYAQVEDMINQGMIALMDCIDRYDPTKGIPFEPYAFLRVRGAVIDLVRKQDWIPRRVRTAAKEIAAAESKLCSELRRSPTEAELAAELNMSVERLRQVSVESANSVTFSFEELIQNVSQMGTALEQATSDDETPESHLLRTELHDALTGAISGLNDRERLVLTLYYYENLTLTEIAKVIEVSVQRVSQIHSRVIQKLKETMADYIRC